MPNVSVIVPVYNVEKHLARCLDSIMAQDYQDFEVICVNDCSPDKSGLILQEYKTRYPEKIKIVNNSENQGIGKSRINGLNQCTGKYVMYVDSDDYLKKDYIKTYVETAEKEQCEVVVGGYIRDAAGKYTEHLTPDSVWSLVTFSDTWAKLFLRSFLVDNNIDFAGLRFGEDVFFSLNVCCNIKNYKIIDYCGYYYYLNPRSLTKTTTYDKNFEVGVAQIFDLFMKKVNVDALPKQKKDVIEYVYIANMINALITHGHGGKIKRMKKKYGFFIEDMKNRFPNYIKNPHIGILKPRGQTLKIRLGVGVVMGLHKIRMDRILFYLISLI